MATCIKSSVCKQGNLIPGSLVPLDRARMTPGNQWPVSPGHQRAPCLMRDAGSMNKVEEAKGGSHPMLTSDLHVHI